MSITVFAGPSISKKNVLELLPNADVQPPAQQGDLYLATRKQPKIILLIDGFFESVPAVWHKEILYAMSIGIHVYGSSSMGALRASELHTFGMIGVGTIYQNFANGTWEDDDEVALTHGPKELGYLAISRAMADLRYDLARAIEKEIITQSQADTIESKLKALWYPNRSKQTLLTLAQEAITTEQFNTLTQFLDNDSQSLKENDAKQLLTQIAKIDLTTLAPKEIDYALCENDAWQTLINDVARTRPTKVQIDLPTQLDAKSMNEETALPAKLRARALEHAESIGIELKPWIRPAFHRAVTKWDCVNETGDIQFEKVSQKLLSLSLTTQQFDQWIEREALLLAYADQIEIQTEHIMDEELIRQE